jgi:hypothetical protein
MPAVDERLALARKTMTALVAMPNCRRRWAFIHRRQALHSRHAGVAQRGETSELLGMKWVVVFPPTTGANCRRSTRR